MDGAQRNSEPPAPGNRPRIGVIITSDRAGGGAFQYAVEILNALLSAGDAIDVRVLDYNLGDDVRELCAARNAIIVPCAGVMKSDSILRTGWRLLRRAVPGVARLLRTNRTAVNALKEQFQCVARQNEIDLFVLCEPTPLGFESGLPFIMPVHDLQHRLQPEWPEVSEHGEFQSREYLYQNAARQARMILVDSETGKEDMLKLYEIPADRVAVLPFVGAGFVRQPANEQQVAGVRSKYDLPERFFFYPAQFWYHKNHVRLAKALFHLKKEHGLVFNLVLTGIRKNAFDAFQKTVDDLGIRDQIHYLGYTPDQDMAALYCGAIALVFPTFFGPTNIPIIEAWSLGVPVVTSDVRGVREQVGDAGLLADPRDEHDIARQMKRVYEDAQLRENVIHNGHRQVANYSHADFAHTLLGIVMHALKSPDAHPASV